MRHRPGIGLALGLAGIALLLLSYAALPWASAMGEDANFSDIRDAYSRSSDDTIPYGGGGEDGQDVDPTDIIPPPLTPPPPVEPSPVGLQQQDPGLPPSPGGDLTPQAPTASSSDNDFMEVYVEALWYGVIAMALVAVVFATWIVPRSHGLRIVTGFLSAGVLGLLINAADADGRVGPRVSGAIVALMCLGVYGYALSILFGEEFSPDPAIGAWAGAAGLVLVVVGCITGTRTDRVPAHG